MSLGMCRPTIHTSCYSCPQKRTDRVLFTVPSLGYLVTGLTLGAPSEPCRGKGQALWHRRVKTTSREALLGNVAGGGGGGEGSSVKGWWWGEEGEAADGQMGPENLVGASRAARWPGGSHEEGLQRAGERGPGGARGAGRGQCWRRSP